MQKCRKRALRRHHASRRLARVETILKNQGWFKLTLDLEWVKRSARIRRDNFVTCSNPLCCGNPRHTGSSDALPVRERRWLEVRYEDALDAVADDNLIE